MKRLFSLLLCMAMLCTLLAGCGNDKEEAVESSAPTESAVGSEAKDQPTAGNVVTLGETLTMEKVGIVHKDRFTAAKGGLYYSQDGKYGVISMDGEKDTGAVYTFVERADTYFLARKSTISSGTDYKNINACGLIDGNGTVLVPFQYAKLEVLNGRYVKTYTAKAVTTNESGYLFSLTVNSDYNYYTGSWSIYDMKTKKELAGLSGTQSQNVTVKGDFLTYYDAEYNNYYANGDNVTLPATAVRIYEDGSYATEEKIGDVYDSKGNKLFSYDLTGFVPQSKVGAYYKASQSTDGKYKYVLMNEKGEIVSAEFTGSISDVKGNLICIYGTDSYSYYTLDGKLIHDGDYSNYEYAGLMDAYLLTDYVGDRYAGMVVKGDGTVIYEFTGKNALYGADFMTLVKENGDEKSVYCYNDGDFTIENVSTYYNAPFVVETKNNNNLYNLVNVINGEIMLEGYSDFGYIYNGGNSFYVYACYNGGADVYLVSTPANLINVTTIKENLLDDLTAAFTAEGLTVSINESTGEIAMDTTVLFGGDSAALTADGKAFLNKFIKVYTQVAFADKYKGFISKTIVEGHTAPVSGSTYASGLSLSEERADNVMKYCLSADTGVDVSAVKKSMEAIGYSNSQPIYNDDGSVNMEASRRVSFRFLVDVDQIN